MVVTSLVISAAAVAGGILVENIYNGIGIILFISFLIYIILSVLRL